MKLLTINEDKENYHRCLLPGGWRKCREERWRITGVYSLNDWMNSDGVIHKRYAGEKAENGRKY